MCVCVRGRVSLYLLNCTRPRIPALSSWSFYSTRNGPPKGGSMMVVTKTPIRRDKGGILLSALFLFEALSASRFPLCLFSNNNTIVFILILVLIFSRYLGRHLLNQHSLVYVFYHSPLLIVIVFPRFPHGVYNSFRVSCASSPLFCPPRSCPSPPVCGIC